MTRLKFASFAVVAVTGSVGVMLLILLAADLYAHRRVERSVGVNRHGYRGPAVAAKPAGSRRVVMLGGSTVFGWDVAVEDTVPALLEAKLRAVWPATSVVNLGFIGEGAHAFLPTLQDFAYLDYDVVSLYEGYNDLLGDARPNTDLFRHQSPVFRLTGYFPILPLFLREKALALRYGSVGAAYTSANGGGTQTEFKTNLANRTSAAALEAAAAIATSLGRQLDRVSEPPPIAAAAPAGAGCPPPWSQYCQSVAAAVRYAVAEGKAVLVIAQPLLKNDRGQRHADQQRALQAMVQAAFGSEPRVRFVDLGHIVDLARTDLAFDGMHLNREGNTIVADALVRPVADAAGLGQGSLP